MPITDNHKYPETNNDTTRDLKISYIEYTSGTWLRHHIEKGEIELWYDGKFQCSYNYDPKLGFNAIICALINNGIELGKDLRSDAIRKLIGAK